MSKRRFPFYGYFLIFIACLALGSCWKLRGHYGGPQSFDAVARPIQPQDIALPEGYQIEAIAQGLTYPSALTFSTAQIPDPQQGFLFGCRTDALL